MCFIPSRISLFPICLSYIPWQLSMLVFVLIWGCIIENITIVEAFGDNFYSTYFKSRINFIESMISDNYSSDIIFKIEVLEFLSDDISHNFRIISSASSYAISSIVYPVLLHMNFMQAFISVLRDFSKFLISSTRIKSTI